MKGVGGNQEMKILQCNLDEIRVADYGHRKLAIVEVLATYGGETVRFNLGFYRSTGVNAGKTQGQWYPIVGIKEAAGRYFELSPYLNKFHETCKASKEPRDGWLIKSLFFLEKANSLDGEAGYSHTHHSKTLKRLAQFVQEQFEAGKCVEDLTLNRKTFNQRLHGDFQTNPNHEFGFDVTQRGLHDRFMDQIICELTVLKKNA